MGKRSTLCADVFQLIDNAIKVNPASACPPRGHSRPAVYSKGPTRCASYKYVSRPDFLLAGEMSSVQSRVEITAAALSETVRAKTWYLVIPSAEMK